jgi:hypothetical protein
MDGSGRASLRNRQFLRKIEPFLPRYVTLDRALVNQEGVDKEGGNVVHSGDVTNDQVVDGIVEDTQQQRKSTRARRPPDRYEAQ